MNSVPTCRRLIGPLHQYSFGFGVAVLLYTANAAATMQTPVLIGDVAHGLSAEDLTQIERVAVDRGGRAWLVIGSGGMVPEIRSIAAYLVPATVAGDVRRGSVLTLVRATPAARAIIEIPQPTDRSLWVVTAAASYAQVVVSGRPFGRVTGEDDINRPFHVIGSFEDAELSGIVAFIRGSPFGPSSVSDGSVRIRGDLPVLSMSRREELIELQVRASAEEYQRILLRPQSSGWQVVSVETTFR